MSQPEELPPWERPEHQTPRVEEPDTSEQRVLSVLLALGPLLLMGLFMLVFVVLALGVWLVGSGRII